MKIAVASLNKGGLDDMVSPVFGRCPVFTIMEVEEKEIKSTEIVLNESIDLPGSAGVKAAQKLLGLSIEVVAAGNFGPNANAIFNEAGIRQLVISGISVRDAVMKAVSGEPAQTTAGAGAATVPSKYGVGTTGRGMGMGMGRGMGQGMGMGRGMGRGMGMGMAQQTPVQPFACPNCGCTLPRKPGVQTMKCPNCGGDMV